MMIMMNWLIFLMVMVMISVMVPSPLILAEDHVPVRLTFQLEPDGFKLAKDIKRDTDDALTFGEYYFDPWTNLFMNYPYEDEPNYSKEIETVHQELKKNLDIVKLNQSRANCARLITQVEILKMFRGYELKDSEILKPVLETGTQVENLCQNIFQSEVQLDDVKQAEKLQQILQIDMKMLYHDLRKWRHDLIAEHRSTNNKTPWFLEMKQNILLGIKENEKKFMALRYIVRQYEKDHNLDANQKRTIDTLLKLSQADSEFMFDVYMALKKIYLSQFN